MKAGYALFLGIVGLALAQSAVAADAPRTVVISSGEASGLYFPEAGAICRLVNRDRARHGLHCLVEPSTGSGANLAALRSGDAQLAIVQSKVLSEAVHGAGRYGKEAVPDLRALLSLHGESVAVVLSPGQKIKSLADLKGKRLNLGRPGTFQRAMADAVLGAEGIRPGELASALEMESAKVPAALCHNEIDAAFFTGLHPLNEVQEAISSCGAGLLALKGAAMDSFLKANPAFGRQVISDASYRGLHEKVPTVGLRAVLVATVRLSDEDAYVVVRAILENLEAFKDMHPLLSGLERKQMAREGLVAPLHDGAHRYFVENGLP